MALEALVELEKRDDTVALFVVDQRVPEMTGVVFLAQAIRLFPDAKRTLLTVYADKTRGRPLEGATNLCVLLECDPNSAILRRALYRAARR
jgi:thioredoxin reductase (NADPH)